MAVDGARGSTWRAGAAGSSAIAGEQIGYIARLTLPGAKPPRRPRLDGATDARLVELVASANQMHRRFAQQELLRRGRTAERIALLEKRVLGTRVRLRDAWRRSSR